MNAFDREILLWVNGFARVSQRVDLSVASLATSNAVKGGVLTVLLLWFWFGEARERERHREIILATGVAAGAALFAGRLLATALPFRVRPVHDPSLGFVAPYGYPEGLLRTWSAFPSDHAMIFAAMATGLYLVSRRVGIAASLYVALVILAPRVYLGMHHPTDVIFGAALGVAFALAANAGPVRGRLARVPLRWSEAHPSAFHAAAFVAAMQIATMFEGPREVVREVSALVRPERGPCATAPGACVLDGADPKPRVSPGSEAAAPPDHATVVAAPAAQPSSASAVGATLR